VKSAPKPKRLTLSPVSFDDAIAEALETTGAEAKTKEGS
jgi:hypothetical protein